MTPEFRRQGGDLAVTTLFSGVPANPLKSIEKVSAVHKKQLLTYLRVSNKKLGLLINFGAPLIKDGISRIANNL